MTSRSRTVHPRIRTAARARSVARRLDGHLLQRLRLQRDVRLRRPRRPGGGRLRRLVQHPDVGLRADRRGRSLHLAQRRPEERARRRPGIDVDPATWFGRVGSDPVFAADPQEEGSGIAVRFDTVPAEVGAGTHDQDLPGGRHVRVGRKPGHELQHRRRGRSRDYFDTYGGFNPSCVPYNAPAYGLLRFDLDAIPDGAVISDARIVTTTRAGYAQDGDPNHHAVFLSDDTWSENGVTWNNKPVDGTVAPGNPNLQRRRRHPALAAGPRLGVHVQEHVQHRLRRQPRQRSSRPTTTTN